MPAADPASRSHRAPASLIRASIDPSGDASGWRGWYVRHGATLVNVVVCVSLAALLVYDARARWLRDGFDYVQVSFVAQTVIMLVMIVVRAPQRAIDADLGHQAVALAAFSSAALFAQAPATTSAAQHATAVAVMLAANVLGAVTILNLGRAFGILVALRRIETRGLYRVVRHPMYATDLLLRVGLVLEVTTARNVAVALASAALYVWRARLEERFLAHEPAYRAYLARVRWRFVPGLY